MKHAESTLLTKRKLAASLKKFMEQKPFSKITVSQLIQDCGVNRKTFYYHFADIYDLFRWMLEEEAVDVVRQFDLMVDYKDAILFVMDYVEHNQHMLNCAYDSMGREGLKRFFYADFVDLIASVITAAEVTEQVQLPKEFKAFLCQFYTEAIAGMLVEWSRDTSQYDRNQVVEYLHHIFAQSLTAMLHKDQ